jgi:hypothetical protein
LLIHRPLAPLLASLAAMVCSLSPLATAQAQAPPQLVVLDLSPERLPAPYEELKLGQEIGRAVEAGGCLVARTCTNEDCARGPGLPAGVHLLTFEVRYDRKQFACSLSLEVRDRPGGRIEYREKASSPVCPAAQALEDIKRAAKVACDELSKTPAPASPAASPTPTPPDSTVRAIAPAASVVEPAIGRAFSTGLVVGGTVALVGGAVLLFLDGQPTSCASSPSGERVCTRTRQTKLPAVPLLLLGASGVGWGAWKLLSNGTDGAVVGIGPGGMTVRGRF